MIDHIALNKIIVRQTIRLGRMPQFGTKKRIEELGRYAVHYDRPDCRESEKDLDIFRAELIKTRKELQDIIDLVHFNLDECNAKLIDGDDNPWRPELNTSTSTIEQEDQ